MSELPKIIPLIVPMINWKQYSEESYHVLKRSITKSLDGANLPNKDFFSFIASLGEFQQAKTEPWGYVRTADMALRHLSFSFLCDTDNETADLVIKNSGLDFFPSEFPTLFILSGNLSVWQTAIISCMRKKKPYKLRLFFNCMYLWFSNHGCSECFKLYSKHAQDDGTFSLEY